MKAIIALVMALAAAGAHGQVMKCVGKDGKVEYAAQCPPGTIEQKTTIFSRGTGAPPAAAAQQKSLAERDAEFRKRQIERQEAQQKAEQEAVLAAQKRDACESSRAYLKSLQAGMRISRTDPKTGERVFLEDHEYAAEMAKAQRAVDQHCG